MSVVNASQFALIRARRELQKAFDQSNWESVRHWDSELGVFLNSAFDDEARDTRALVTELENILATYGKLVESLPGQTDKRLKQPD